MKLDYVSKFIDHLMAPIKRIDSLDELVDFTIENQVCPSLPADMSFFSWSLLVTLFSFQVVAVANLNVNIPQENDLYKTYYLSSLKAFSSSNCPISQVILKHKWSVLTSSFSI